MKITLIDKSKYKHILLRFFSPSFWYAFDVVCCFDKCKITSLSLSKRKNKIRKFRFLYGRLRKRMETKNRRMKSEN